MAETAQRRAAEAPALPAFADGGARRMLIGADWVEAASGRRFEARNPATGTLLATLPEGDAEDVDRAVAAARAALDGSWSKAKPDERQAALLRLADLVDTNYDELAWLDTLDMGGPISRTRLGRKRMVGLLRFYAGQATALTGETIENSVPGAVLTFTAREPVGVVGAIIPWNAPLGMSVLKVGPALATGCAIVLKPAEDASLSPLRFAELVLEAGVPPGVVNVVTGFGRTAGAAIAAHPGIDKVAFTGSHVTGQEIVRLSAANLKRLSLELGGKSANIVFADADLDAAVPGAAMAAFANSGQVCSAGTRLFVERSIYDDVVARVAAFGAALKVGDGADPQTQLGPLISARQLERVASYLDIGAAEGAHAVSGGARLTDGAYAKGFYVPPTVFSGVEDRMRIAQEEIFGPVLCVIPFDGEAEVIARANASMFGLGAGVWTRDVGRALRVARAMKAGSVWANCYQLMDPAVSFGGYRMSGYGRESGARHLDEYLSTKSVWINAG